MFYNLIEDKITNLRVFPFQIMDIALNTYKKMEVNEAKDTIRRLILQIKKVGGLFISVWHNTSLLDTSEGREWRDVFEFTLKEQDL